MAIFRCNQCTHIQEVTDTYIDKKAKCPKCESTVSIYDTVRFSKSLIDKYFKEHQKVNELESKLVALENLNQEVIENNPIDTIDIYDTKVLMHQERYAPIVDWFESRYINVAINKNEMDTTGFFDEAAVYIGKNYDILKMLLVKSNIFKTKVMIPLKF